VKKEEEKYEKQNSKLFLSSSLFPLLLNDFFSNEETEKIQYLIKRYHTKIFEILLTGFLISFICKENNKIFSFNLEIDKRNIINNDEFKKENDLIFSNFNFNCSGEYI
jgi:hypothetical protein